MSHAQCTWPDRIPLRPPHSTPSLPYPLNVGYPVQSATWRSVRPSCRTESHNRLWAQRSRRGYHRDEQVLGRLTTLARTLPLLLHCSLHRCWHSAAPSRIHPSNRENSVWSSSHIPTSTRRPVAMYPHKRKSSRDPNLLQVSFSEREQRSLLSFENLSIILELQADRAAQREQAALSKLSYEIARRILYCLKHDLSWICKN